jgi:hypothetical protein
MSSPFTSFVGWIDYSEKERASMMNALGLFSQGTVDANPLGRPSGAGLWTTRRHFEKPPGMAS